MIKKIYIVLTLTSVFFLYIITNKTHAITDPAIKYPWLELYLQSPNLVWEKPDWFIPIDHRTAPKDMNFWLQVLPFPEDRHADLYLVIPWLWLVAPIISVPHWSQDYYTMLSWREIGINNYLQHWILEYVWSVPPWFEWKRIDFGHSNYFRNDPGRYKTIFANLMWLDPGDQVWYFQRLPWWTFEFFPYEVTASYPTDPSDVEALLRDWLWADALIFGCYYWIAGRRMVEATYLWTPRKQESTVTVLPDLYPDVPQHIVNRVERAVSIMNLQSIDKRKLQIIILFQWIQRARNSLRTSDNQFAFKSQLLELIEDKLAAIYPL